MLTLTDFKIKAWFSRRKVRVLDLNSFYKLTYLDKLLVGLWARKALLY